MQPNQNSGGYPGNQQPPQIFGPQQSGPSSPYGNQPGQFPKIMEPTPIPPPSKKKWVLIGGAIILIFTILLVVILSIPKKESGGPNDQGQANEYDSPLGLIPVLNDTNVKNGKFKLTASYVTGGNFTREGSFYVENGRMYFDMLPDVDTVNKLIEPLYKKQNLEYTAAQDGATQLQTYDFASLMGFYRFYDPNTYDFGGFIPTVEAANANKEANKNKLLKLGAACDTALNDLKSKLGTNITTKSLSFEGSDLGAGRTQQEITFESRQAIDAKIIEFFERCYDLANPKAASIRKYVEGLQDKSTPSPKFTYWTENDRYFMTITGQAKDEEFAGELKFELYDLNKADGEKQGDSGSYREHRNMFGLAYSVCKVPPVMVVDSPNPTYRFMPEDVTYIVPSDKDAGYYCTTLNLPNQYVAPASLKLVLNKTTSDFPKADIDRFRAVHDIQYQIEKFNSENKRFPGMTEFNDLATNNMGSLLETTQGALKVNTIRYTPTPLKCIGNCSDYTLSHLPRIGQLLNYGSYKN